MGGRLMQHVQAALEASLWGSSEEHSGGQIISTSEQA